MLLAKDVELRKKEARLQAALDLENTQKKLALISLESQGELAFFREICTCKRSGSFSDLPLALELLKRFYWPPGSGINAVAAADALQGLRLVARTHSESDKARRLGCFASTVGPESRSCRTQVFWRPAWRLRRRLVCFKLDGSIKS